MRLLSPLTTALRTLTILPIPGRETAQFSRAVIFFPFAGAVLALVPAFFLSAARFIELLATDLRRGASFLDCAGWSLFGVCGLDLGISPFHWLIIAVLALAVTTFLTGGLHIDGLADAADAFAPGRSKEKILEILRDPHVGSFGVTAIVFGLLLKAACWAVLFGRGNLAAIAVSLIASRSLQSVALTFFPTVSAKGLAVAYAQGVGRVERVWTILLAVLVTAGATYFLPSATGAVAMAAMWIVGLTLGAYFTRRIGGINGDCVGAMSEFGEVTVLVVAVL